MQEEDVFSQRVVRWMTHREFCCLVELASPLLPKESHTREYKIASVQSGTFTTSQPRKVVKYGTHAWGDLVMLFVLQRLQAPEMSLSVVSFLFQFCYCWMSFENP